MLFLRRIIFNFSINKFNTSKDYYKMLGVSTSADQKQIKKAFRDLAKRFHPDSKSGNQEKFKQVNQAYQVLSQKDVRKQYDEARRYSSSGSSGNYSNPGYSQQQPNYGYQNYGNNQNYSYQNTYQQNPNQNSTYRGYTRTDGWQNQKYREDVMNEIFKQYQRNNMYAQAQKNRANYGSFDDMYKNHQEKIRQYSQNIKKRQEQVRRSFQAQQIRKQQEFRQYQQKQMRDLQEQIHKKVNDVKDGIVKNVHGFVRMGQYLKDTWKNVTQAVSNKSQNQNDKKNSQNKKK